MKGTEEIVVIGGSAAGPSAASRARRVNPKVRITIYEKGVFVSYGA
jgi:protoporphyrinogen oxidase